MKEKSSGEGTLPGTGHRHRQRIRLGFWHSKLAEEFLFLGRKMVSSPI
ncbi:MAG: hypothetical protein ABIK47_05435 [candidate division WOR-3 bacterium]